MCIYVTASAVSKLFCCKGDCISGVMDSMISSSGCVDRGFNTRTGKTKDYRIDICYFSAKNAPLRSMNKVSESG